jgi:hypothetical protein
MTPGNILIIPGKIAGKDDLERARGLRAASCLWQMLAAAKAQLGTVDWYALGLADAEAALEAWQTGGQHGFFDIWEQRRGKMGRNRPAPSSTELRARRMAILFCIALERGGLIRRAARKFAARELERANVFATAPSPRAIQHWQTDQPPLGATDEQVSLLRGRPAAPPRPLLRRAGPPPPQPNGKGHA